MVKILASTRSVPELIDGLARRHADGLGAGDEWDAEVLRLLGPPSPDRGEVAARVVASILPLADSLGLCTSAPCAIGLPGRECRVASVVVYDPATPRTTSSTLSTAELVVDVVDDGGAGTAERLEFHGRWRVREHLEIDLVLRTVVLHACASTGWQPATHSAVLGFDVDGDSLRSLRGTYRIVWPGA